MDGRGDGLDAIINALLNESNRSVWDSAVPAGLTGNSRRSNVATGTGGITAVGDLSRNQRPNSEYAGAADDSTLANARLQDDLWSGDAEDFRGRIGASGGLSQDEKRRRNREIQARYRQRQRELRLQTEQNYEEMVAQLQQERLENQRESMKLKILGKLLTVRSSFTDILEKTAGSAANQYNNDNDGRQRNITENKLDNDDNNNDNDGNINKNTGEKGGSAPLQQVGRIIAVKEQQRQGSAGDSSHRSYDAGVQMDDQTGRRNEVVQEGIGSSGLLAIRAIAGEIRQYVEESIGVGREKEGYTLAQANAIVAGIRERVASEEYAERVTSAISSLRVEEFNHFLSMFASGSKKALLEADIPMNKACAYEDTSYDAKREFVMQQIMPIYSEFLVHLYGTAKYRPKLLLRFLPDEKDSGQVLVSNMSHIVACLNFSEEQKQSILDARDQCCNSKEARLAMLSEKYLVLQNIFECSEFDSMQAMTSRYLELFDGTGRFIESALDDFSLHEMTIWMTAMGRTMDLLQKCILFGMSYPQLPNVVQIPDLC